MTSHATDPEVLRDEYREKCPGFEEVRQLHAPPSKRLLLGSGLAADGLEALDRADVVHAHGVWEPVLVAAARRVRRRRGVFVLRPAGMLDPWSLAQKPLKKRLARALTHRAIFRGRGFVHALTDAEQEHVGSLAGVMPIRIVPNGVSDAMLRAAETRNPDTYRRTLPELGTDPYVLFLGRLHHKKGLDRLARAFSVLAERHDRVQLVVAGQEEGAGPEAARVLAAAGVSRRAHFVGPLLGEAKQAAMQGAACFALPSRQEGFSVAVLEALATGCPAVITPECHFDALEPAGAGRVVNGDDAAAVAAAWHGYLDSADARSAAGAAATRLVSSAFTWDHIAERLAGLYDDCLRDPGFGSA
ncbi:glycosyltransferase involved in cell wall biosynthesis [Phycisphaera mikurensis]|nr:glycosyltransferase [Phycisphaera mikurensis]MBB6441778.1 glycosyltransferase involved in cell wall biosynthesis [Phycisphaera mikurensis]